VSVVFHHKGSPLRAHKGVCVPCARAGVERAVPEMERRVVETLVWQTHERSTVAPPSLFLHPRARAPASALLFCTARSMAPPILPSGDPRRPAEARPHPPRARKGDSAADTPDLRSMLATVLAVLAIMGKVKAAAWASAIVLASAAVNLEGRDLGTLMSAAPAVVFGFVSIYRAPAGGAPGGVVASPREAWNALVARFAPGR
jgi:hypothetical protein